MSRKSWGSTKEESGGAVDRRELNLPKEIARAVGVAVLKDGKVLVAFSGNPDNPNFTGPVAEPAQA